MLQGEREITLRFLAEPTNISFEGKVRSVAVMRKGRVVKPVYALNETGVSRWMDVKAVEGRSVGGCP